MKTLEQQLANIFFEAVEKKDYCEINRAYAHYRKAAGEQGEHLNKELLKEVNDKYKEVYSK